MTHESPLMSSKVISLESRGFFLMSKGETQQIRGVQPHEHLLSHEIPLMTREVFLMTQELNSLSRE